MRPMLVASHRSDQTSWAASIALFVLIALVFFYRGTVLGGLSISLLIPIVAIVTAGTLLLPPLWQTGRFPALPAAFAVLFVAWLASVLISAALHPHEAAMTYHFGIELLLNGLIFYVGLTLARGVNAIDRVFTFIVAASVPLGVAMLMLARQIAAVRRIGAADAHLGAAVDHLGHAFAIVALACVFKLLRGRDRPMSLPVRGGLIAALVLSISAVLLSGSKAALAGILVFFFSLGVVGLLRERRFIVSLAVGLAGLGGLIAYVFLQSDGKFAPLASRFTPDNFMAAVSDRITAMRSAGRGVVPGDLILGMPWRYEPLNPDSPIRYPHNMLWSMWLHTGFVAFVGFGYILLSRLWRLASRAVGAQHGWFMPLVLLFMFLITILYGFTSGRLTRIMTIFFVLGLIDGYLASVRQRA
jgi:hypothetical protein